METKELVVKKDTQISVTDSPVVSIPGLDEMGRADMILPRVRLVQAQSDFSDAAGELYNSLTDTSKPLVHCVVIGVKQGRVRWPEAYQRGQDPICASDDGVIARTGLFGETVTGSETPYCAQCIFAQWGANGEPPVCAMFYNFLAVDVEEGDVPFLISFGRTSTRAGKQLITLLKAHRLSKTFVIGSAQEKNDKGKFYILTVKPGDAIPVERQSHYMAVMRSFSGIAITSDTDAAPAAQMVEEVPF